MQACVWLQLLAVLSALFFSMIPIVCLLSVVSLLSAKLKKVLEHHFFAVFFHFIWLINGRIDFTLDCCLSAFFQHCKTNVVNLLLHCWNRIDWLNLVGWLVEMIVAAVPVYGHEHEKCLLPLGSKIYKYRDRTRTRSFSPLITKQMTQNGLVCWTVCHVHIPWKGVGILVS